MRNTSTVLLYLLILFTVSCQPKDNREEAKPEPRLLFADDGTDDWRKQWFLDGERGQVINGEDGMELIAGPEAGNDTCHVVLWTKQSFRGDIAIEYDYVRTDTITRFVNILYFLATGQGDEAYPSDISAWNDKRVVPHMRTYFNHMKSYHISYATGSWESDDYIRFRRYDPANGGRLKGTDIADDQFNTGLFKPGGSYHIRVSKLNGRITMDIQNNENEAERKTISWDVSNLPIYDTGRVGFRHMYTRSARYRNIRVWGLG